MKPRIAYLVTHGTDTMAWGLTYLTYSICNAAFNVALVGSQIPMDDRPNGSDGYLNLEMAVLGLAELQPPGVFVAMNAGRLLFHEHAWKIDKWDTTAFDGKLLLEKRSNEMIFRREALMDAERRLDVLHVVRTGGTIEQTLKDNVLQPDEDKDVVVRFLRDSFSVASGARCVVGEIRDDQLMALDSSDLVPADWQRVAEHISVSAGSHGYTPRLKVAPTKQIPLLMASPFVDASHFLCFADQPGLVFVGYGGGNVHQRHDTYSPKALFESVRDAGGWVVVGSHPPGGTLDPVYENGAKVFERGLALPTMDFSLARAQTKLAFLIEALPAPRGTRQSLTDEERLFAALYLSGASFPRPATRSFFEDIWNIRIPERDLLIDNEMERAIRLGEDTLRATPGFHGLWRPDMPSERRLAVILRPDRIVGENHRGEEVDAAAAIARILAKAFEWDTAIADLTADRIDDAELHASLREAVLLVLEGGRPSAYDADSFVAPYASADAMGVFYRQMVLERGQSAQTTPRIYICLSHQLVCQALHDLVLETCAERQHDTSPAWKELSARISDRFRAAPSQFVVRHNEQPENLVTRLVPFRPSCPEPELVEAHRRVATAHTGLLEDFIPHERLDISMMHGDEVSEAGLLLVNWAIELLADYRAHAQPAPGDVLHLLPVGVEITASTLDLDGTPITEVASMAIHYRDARGQVYRDFSFQFHPELIAIEELRATVNEAQIRLDVRNDGLKILLAAVMGGRASFSG